MSENKSTMRSANAVTITRDADGEASVVELRADKIGDPTGSPTQHTAGVNERTVVEPVQKRIADIAAMLAEETGQLDPQTRQPAKLISDPTRRANLERELRHLEERELPYAQARAAQIAAERASLPSRNDTMREELERRARIQARAAELADEQEAEAQARRLAASRQRH